MEQWVNLFGNPDFLGLVATIVTIIFSYFKVRERVANTRYDKAYTLLEDAVRDTYHNYVRVVKAEREKAGDPAKLTLEEKGEAIRRAIRYALGGMARNQLEKYLGTSNVEGVVEEVVRREGGIQ